MIFAQDNLHSWMATWERYWRVFSGSFKEAVAHQSKWFGIYARDALKEKAKKKGEIKKERLAALRKGTGLKIHENARMPNVWGGGDMPVTYLWSNLNPSSFSSTSAKRNAARRAQLFQRVQYGDNSGYWRGFRRSDAFSMQAVLADEELRWRESHRLFAYSAMLFKGTMSDDTQAVSKGDTLGTFSHLQASGYGMDAVSKFEWKPSIGRYSGQAAKALRNRAPQLNLALHRSRKNMEEYITKKEKQAARRAAATVRSL